MTSLIKELRAPVKNNKKKVEASSDDPDDKEELELEVCALFRNKSILYICTQVCMYYIRMSMM